MYQDQYDARFKYCFYYSYKYAYGGVNGIGYTILYSDKKEPELGEALTHIYKTWNRSFPIIHDIQAVFIPDPNELDVAMTNIKARFSDSNHTTSAT